ncbi:hypothetical protein BJX63DRAFT_438336 [Aspergillus granulosus]|uniref:Uncharacterized protein n=1 Tax=Aspergillus granulosus TaxID=176169 RepID=A0ABR4GSS1_9EURO
MANTMQWDVVRERLNHAVLVRFTAPGSGHRRTLHVQAVDIAMVMGNKKLQAVTEAEAAQHHLTLNRFGMLAHAAQSATGRPATGSVLRDAPGSSEVASQLALMPGSPTQIPGGATQTCLTNQPVVNPVVEPCIHVPGSGPTFPIINSQPTLGSIPQHLSGNMSGQSGGAIVSGPSRASTRIAAQTAQCLPADAGNLVDNNNDLMDMAEEEEEAPQEEVAVKKKLCGCRNVPSVVLRDIVASKTIKDSRLIVILGMVWHIITTRNSQMCFLHKRLLGSKIGLRTGALNKAQLGKRLKYICQHRDTLEDIRASDTHYNWFRRADRPVRPEDKLGIFQYTHTPLCPFPSPAEASTSWILYITMGRYGSTDRELDNWWDEQGSIKISGLMDWWKTGAGEQGAAETETLLDLDLSYYMWYTYLRPDKQWRLISYPYYAKNAQPGDSTFFRHIDIDVEQAVERGRGINSIQGSMSLDDEDKKNCTEILPGMHQHLAEWNSRVKARGEKLNNLVNKILPAQFSAEDAAYFKTQWIPQPCKALDVRITQPGLPHGSTGPATKVRRTILPWFVGIQSDHSTLDMQEGGTWEELAAAHRNMTPGPASPSGLANHYAVVPYAFPASVMLTGLGPVSDALVGRRRWDSIEVIEELNIIFGVDREAARQHVTAWRKNAFKQATKALHYFFAIEEKIFRDKSFNCRAMAGASASVLPHLDLLEEREDRDHY